MTPFQRRLWNRC